MNTIFFSKFQINGRTNTHTHFYEFVSWFAESQSLSQKHL